MTSFFKNWELKVLALISAIILWFFVVGFENNSARFPEDIDIHAVNIPQGMSLSNDLGKASIRIRADQDVLKTLTGSDFDLSVDVKNLSQPEQELPLSATSKNDKVTILKVEPATVHVVLEQITDRDLKIKPVIIGNPAKGYSVSTIDVSPQTVTVTGGKTLVAKLSTLNAEIKLDGTERTNFKQNITLKLPGTLSSLKNVTMSPQQITVEVTITQDLQQKTVVVKPDLSGATDIADLSKKLLVTPQTVIIEGKEDVLDKISSIETEPVVFDTLKNSDKPLKAKLILPTGVTLSETEANSVMISLTTG